MCGEAKLHVGPGWSRDSAAGGGSLKMAMLLVGGAGDEEEDLLSEGTKLSQLTEELLIETEDMLRVVNKALKVSSCVQQNGGVSELSNMLDRSEERALRLEVQVLNVYKATALLLPALRVIGWLQIPCKYVEMHSSLFLIH